MLPNLMRWITRTIVLVSTTALAISCSPSNVDLTPPATRPTTRPLAEREPSTQPVERLDFIAFGDWGQLNDTQRKVAATMRDYVVSQKRDPTVNFAGAFTAGDNIYLRNLTGFNDPRLRQVFADMYDPAVLDFPFYISLGNHDYEDSKLQIELGYGAYDPTGRWTMPDRYYRLDLPAGAKRPLVTVLMLDSTRDKMKPEEWARQNEWIDRELRRPRIAHWTIAVAHHPLYSNGDHGDIGPLQVAWGDLFLRGNLDMYVAGHDHDIQHLEIDGFKSTSFVMVGGGGAKVRPMRNEKRGPFSRQSFGFGHVTITHDKMIVRLVDDSGKVVHAFERDHNGDMRILESSPSDPATPRTAKSINRPDKDD